MSSLLLGDAVLREVRPLARLPLALANVRAVLPVDRWMVQFLHGPRNTDAVLAEPSLARAVTAGTLQLHRYEMGGALVDETLDRHAHFNYQKTARFWRSFGRPLLLLFEPDTVLCPQPRLPLDAFAGYAFTGAPWAAYADGSNPAWCYNLEHCVGNSGLSLWRRDAVADALTNYSTTLSLVPMVLAYLEGRQRRGSRKARPGVGSQKALRLGEAALRAKHVPLSAIAATLDKMGVDTCAAHTFRMHPCARAACLLLCVRACVRDAGPPIRVHIGARLSPATATAWIAVFGRYMSTVLQALRYHGRLPIPATPSEDIAAQFSVETSYDDASGHAPCGTHKPWRFLADHKLRKLMRHCPPLRSLMRATANESGRVDARVVTVKGEQSRLAGLVASDEFLPLSA